MHASCQTTVPVVAAAAAAAGSAIRSRVTTQAVDGRSVAQAAGGFGLCHKITGALVIADHVVPMTHSTHKVVSAVSR